MHVGEIGGWKFVRIAQLNSNRLAAFTSSIPVVPEEVGFLFAGCTELPTFLAFSLFEFKRRPSPPQEEGNNDAACRDGKEELAA